MSAVEIVMRGEPVAWARAGHHGPISFTPAKQKHAMLQFKHIAGLMMGDRPLLQGSLSVHYLFAYPWPKTMSQKKRRKVFAYYRQSRPDLDNLIKLIGDALNKVVWLDDSQIAEMTAKKIYSEIPEVRVTVHLLSEVDEKDLHYLSEVDHDSGREGRGIGVEAGGAEGGAGAEKVHLAK